MPKIYLKPNSPEFAEEDKEYNDMQPCDMPGCNEKAEFRAPKDRTLKSYFSFCFEHVRSYNEAWNFMNGLSEREIEEFFWTANLWDRPTWKRQNYKNLEEEIRAKAWKTYGYGAEDSDFENSQTSQHFARNFNENTPEGQAVKILGLTPPIDFEKLKKRYKELVKQFHPDLQNGSQESEEAMKKINMAYTVLKVAYKKFETLADPT